MISFEIRWFLCLYSGQHSIKTLFECLFKMNSRVLKNYYFWCHFICAYRFGDIWAIGDPIPKWAGVKWFTCYNSSPYFVLSFTDLPLTSISWKSIWSQGNGQTWINFSHLWSILNIYSMVIRDNREADKKE